MRMAAIYARVSSEQQREENTIASQTAALIEFAKNHDLEVPKDWVFEDEGYSGATLERPGLERVRDLAAEGQIQVMLAYSPDRLSRKYAYQILLIEEFARHGVEMVFVKSPPGDSAEDQLLVQFQGMIAEYERAQILERSRRGKRHRAQSGGVSVLSNAPYGYRYIRKTDEAPAAFLVEEAEARVVRRIYEMYTVEGLKIGEITQRLNRDGVPTREASPRWERSTVWAILRNPAYRGLPCFGKTRISARTRVMRAQRRRGIHTPNTTASHERPREEWIEIPVPALVTEETFARAQELLYHNKIRSRRRTIAPSVVQGLVSCAKCGYAFSRTSTQTSARKLHYYKCIGSDSWRKLGGPVCDNGRFIRQELLDQIVWAEVIRLLEEPALIQQELDRRLEAARPLIQPENVSRVCSGSWPMLPKASNDCSTPIRKNSCRSSSCGNACRGCVSANRQSRLSCGRSLTRPAIALHSCAWQKPSQHSLLACAVRRKRLVSWNARQLCDFWLKRFWSAKIPSLFATAFRFLPGRPDKEDRSLRMVKITFCVRGVVSPILSNTFLHYAFDLWMARTHPDLPWCRYADDGLVHCRSEQEAQALKAELHVRLSECHLELHPTKTKIVYCRDGKRKGRYPNVKFDFLGYCFRPRLVRSFRDNSLFCGFNPAVSVSAMKSMRSAIRDLNLRHQTQLSLDDIARQLNPLVRGWIEYYGRYAPTALYPVLRYVNLTILAWVMRKFKRYKGHKIRASQFLQRLAVKRADLFVHWKIGMSGTFT